MTFTRLAALCASVALATPAMAATTWLVPGNGSNTCTIVSPNCNTVAQAVTASASGDTISIAAGSFAVAGVNLTKTLTITGAGMASTTLTVTGIGLNIRANGIAISDLTISGGATGIAFPVTTDTTSITRVTFSGATSRGIDFTTAGGNTTTNVSVTDCSISTNTANGSGIRMASNSRVDGLSIVNTSFTGNSIGLYQANDGNTSRLSNLLVDDSVFSGNPFAAIYMEEVRDASIEDSLFTNNGYGILLFKNYTGSGVAVSNLAIRRNTMSGHTNPALELESIAAGLETPLVVEGNAITHNVGVLASNSAAIDIALSAAFTHAQVELTSNFVQLTGAFTTRTAAYGVLVRGNGPVVLTGNTLDGGDVGGSGTTPPTSGVYVQSRHSSFGTIPATASITGTCNRITRFRNGISVWDNVGSAYGGLLAGTTVSFDGGAISGNSDAGVVNGATPPTVGAENDYWGCPTGPGTAGCDSVVGDVDADPFLATVPACVGCVANGECDDGLFCNGAETCSGAMCVPSSDPCAGGPACENACNEATDDCVVPAGTVCRSAAGDCDVAETCTGLGGGCPADAVAASGTGCRSASGACDVAEACDGVSPTCPADGVAASGTLCRSAAGVCDLAEACDGASAACPGDAKQPASTSCTDDGNACTLDRCDGSNDACQHPAGNAGAVCRAGAGVCDVAETCTGASTACPADAFVPASTVCRSSSGVCDPAESCTGSSATCPADVLAADTDGDGTCDALDDCPAISDPGQVDQDGDGVGDACDYCNNIRNVFAVKPKITIVKLLTPVGDDKLKFKGSMTVPALPGDPTFDPRVEGARAVITDATGAVVLDVTIPPGAYDPVNKVGWKANGSATAFTYVSGAKPVPQPLGIKKFGLKTTPKTPGLIKFTITGKNGAYVVNTANLPLTGTVILDVPFATTGLCGEALFPGAGNPAGLCTVVSNGNGVRCK